jgi:hypothetical protein
MLEITSPDTPEAEPVYSTVEDFLAANADGFDAADVAEVRALAVDGEITYGGGAAGLFVVRRTA